MSLPHSQEEKRGSTGHAPGSRTWGGSNTIVLLGIADDRLAAFRENVSKHWAQKFARTHLKPRHATPLPFHVFVFPCIQWRDTQIVKPLPEMRAETVKPGGQAVGEGRRAHVLVHNPSKGSAPLTVQALVDTLLTQ